MRTPERAAIVGYRILINGTLIEERDVGADVLGGPCLRSVSRPAIVVGAPEIAEAQLLHDLPEIPAGASIEVELRYQQRLAYDDGTIELAVAVGGPVSGPIKLTIEAIGLGPIHSWWTNQPRATASAAGTRLSLAYADEAAVEELFLLRYRSAGDQPQGAAFVAPTPTGGGVLLVELEPPRIVDAADGPRDFSFVLGDGCPSFREWQRWVVARLLTLLRPGDTLQIYRLLPRDVERLSEAPLPANRAALLEAAAFLEKSTRADWTGSLGAAITAPPRQGSHHAVFVFLDGYDRIRPEHARWVATAVRQEDREGRVFTVDLHDPPMVTPATGRLLGLVGASSPVGIREVEDLPAALQSVRDSLRPSILGALELDWSALEVIPPISPPLLHVDDPLLLVAGYAGAPPEGPSLSARLGGAATGLTLELPIYEVDETVLGVAADPDACAGTRRPGDSYVSDHCTPGARAWPAPFGYRPSARGTDADLTPRAHEDAGGVRLGGTPSAESVVLIDGAPAHVDVRSATPDEGAGSPAQGRERRAVEPSAQVRVNAPRAGAALRRLQDSLNARSGALAECFVAAPSRDYRVRHRLRLRGEWTPQDGVRGLTITATAPVAEVTSTCLRDQIEIAANLALAAADAGPFELSLRVWMTY